MAVEVVLVDIVEVAAKEEGRIPVGAAHTEEAAVAERAVVPIGAAWVRGGMEAGGAVEVGRRWVGVADLAADTRAEEVGMVAAKAGAAAEEGRKKTAETERGKKVGGSVGGLPV